MNCADILLKKSYIFRICAVDLLDGAHSVAPRAVDLSARLAASKFAAIPARPPICSAIKIAAWVVRKVFRLPPPRSSFPLCKPML